MTASPSALRSAIEKAMSKAPKCDAECLAPIRSFPILDVVKEMQPELTSKEPKTMPLALQVLAFAAIERPSSTASNNNSDDRVDDNSNSEEAENNNNVLPNVHALEVLFSFLVTKINHFTTIDSAVDAVSRVFVWYAAHHPHLLTKPSKEPGTTPILKSVVNNMLCKISVPSMFGNSKTSAFNLLKALLSPSVVESFSKEESSSFLEAFLVSVDGERDPVFVLDVFTMAYSILTSFSASVLANYTEDYFMTLSNYFPVLFNPPPKCTVTKEELKTALTKVLTLPVFNEVCIPFVLSKLSSPAEVAKVDSLGLIHDIFSRAASSSSSASSSPMSSPPYSPAMLESHVADVLGALRGEALKLAASVAFNPSAKDLLRLAMGVVEDVGRVLDVVGGGRSGNGGSVEVSKEARENILNHCDRTLSACLGTVEAGSDARAYAMLFNALCKGGPVIASVLCGYLLPMLGIKLLGLEVAAPDADQKKISSKAAGQEERIYMSAVAVVGGLFSALEMRKNGIAAEKEGKLPTIAVKAQTTACIVAALAGVLGSSSAPHPYLEDTLPLVAEVLATFIAIRNILPGGEEKVDDKSSEDDADNAAVHANSPFLCPSSETLCQQMLRRACAAHTDKDASAVILKALSNVARVRTDTVLRAALTSSSSAGAPCLAYELVASPRLPAFFIQLHNAVGAASPAVRKSALEVLLLSAGSSNKDRTIIGAALPIFGVSNPVVDSLLHAVSLFTASEAAGAGATAESGGGDEEKAANNMIKSVIDELLALGIPEQSSAGSDLLCDLLARCPSAQEGLLSEADPAGKNVIVSWLCAVASAGKPAIAAHYNCQGTTSWIGLCLTPLASTNARVNVGSKQTVKALALRAIASIANKGEEGIVNAESFENVISHERESNGLVLSAGDVASVRSAVCKGLLARGGGVSVTVVEILRPLLSALHEQQHERGAKNSNGNSGPSDSAACFAPVPLSSDERNSMQLLISAFGQLVSPPFPSPSEGGHTPSSPLWVQKAYLALTDELLKAKEGEEEKESSEPSPLSLMCVAELVKRAPAKVVAATSLELIQKLSSVLEKSNTLHQGKSKGTTNSNLPAEALASVAFVASPSAAAIFCLAQFLDRADAMPIDALRAATACFLTYGVASKALYGQAYYVPPRRGGVATVSSASKNSQARVPMTVRDLLVSALLAACAVVAAGIEGGSGATQATSIGTANKSRGGAPEDPLKPLAREAKVGWILPWLQIALDDPKRQVRTLASKASHEWHKIK